MLCDALSLGRLAGYYHQRALRLAEALQQPLLLGNAATGLGYHALHRRGAVETALAHFRRAAAVYREAGALRQWGAATCALLYIVSYTRGSFAEDLEQARELVRVGQDAADQHLLGWGLVCEGGLLAAAGQLEAAVGRLQEGIALLEAVPDYVVLGTGLGLLGQTYLLQDKLPDALEALEEAEQIVVRYGVNGFLCTAVFENLADAYLLIATRADPTERASVLRKAHHACEAALAQTRVARERQACAYRLQGTYQWLRGNRRRAQAWWQRSLKAAEALGARYDLARTHLELGGRLGEPEHLQRAAAIFGEIGSLAYRAQAQALLRRAATEERARQSSERLPAIGGSRGPGER
jgi:tetratricopeptide (TPR) repeat protein